MYKYGAFNKYIDHSVCWEKSYICRFLQEQFTGFKLFHINHVQPGPTPLNSLTKNQFSLTARFELDYSQRVGTLLYQRDFDILLDLCLIMLQPSWEFVTQETVTVQTTQTSCYNLIQFIRPEIAVIYYHHTT